MESGKILTSLFPISKTNNIMSISINEIEKNSLYTVNNKEVYLDGDGKWVSRQELTAQEHEAFAQYRASNL